MYCGKILYCTGRLMLLTNTRFALLVGLLADCRAQNTCIMTSPTWSGSSGLGYEDHGQYAALSTSTRSEEGSTQPTYMELITTWRKQLGLTPLLRAKGLEYNAYRTCVQSKGQMIHNLQTGSRAQVLAPGEIDRDFHHILVGGWLCERPQMKGLAKVCDTESRGWIHTTKGHADALTSLEYSHIGCASSHGIVACDLA